MLHTDYQDIGAYITAEAEMHLKMQSCSIQLSDLERIRVILTGCSTEIRTAYQAFKQRKTEDGQWTHLRDCDVNTFAQDIEAVADAIQWMPLQQNDHAAKTRNKTNAKQNRPEDAVQQDENTGDRPCWDHPYLQQGCPRGDTCPWKHVGESGGKKLRFATEDGTCRRYLTDSCDRGDQCKFKHQPEESPSKKPAAAAAPSGRRVCYDFSHGSCKRGDQCNYTHMEDGKPAPSAHHAKPSTASDDDDGDLYEGY